MWTVGGLRPVVWLCATATQCSIRRHASTKTSNHGTCPQRQPHHRVRAYSSWGSTLHPAPCIPLYHHAERARAPLCDYNVVKGAARELLCDAGVVIRGCRRLRLAFLIVWCECAVFALGCPIAEANKPCLAGNCKWCTCTSGRPAPALGDDADLVCATNGAEDCDACDAGNTISEPVRVSQRGSLQSTPLASPTSSLFGLCHAMPCHADG